VNGNLNFVKELKEKARKAFIKKSIQFKIPIRVWLNIFQSLEPI